MISLEDARAYVHDACGPLPVRPAALADARGCVLAEPIVAAEAIPPFANSAVDGFAVRAADTRGATAEQPVRLRVVATLAAGTAPEVAVGPGEAIRIMTGAPVPDGADAIVMVERTVAAADGTTVEVQADAVTGDHVRAAGDDLQPGQPVFAVGERLTAGHLGVLASLGLGEILVVPRARVGVFSTGDELVEAGRPLAPGQIRDSNRITLLALLEESGCEAVDLGLVPDDEDAIAAAITGGAATCDALLTSGGVSMGDFDYVKVVLDRLGDMRWMQVAIKPAKPFAFGTVPGPDGRRVPVFGLPGNPVSSMVSFEVFARPGLRQMMGRTGADRHRPHVRAVADEVLTRRPDGKTHFARVRHRYSAEDQRHHVVSAGGQGSHHLTAMAHADALAVLPDGGPIEVGDTVEVMLLS